MRSKLLALLALIIIYAEPSHAMHIMEGYLPLSWSLFWTAVAVPFVILSYRHIAQIIKAEPKGRIHFALNTAFVFVLSALKLPSVTGSSSHLTGTTLGTLTTGVMSMPLVGFIVLLFQALLLAHGGISTLGANIFSLAIAGPFAAYFLYRTLKGLGLGQSPAVFIAAALGSLTTYITTSFQLAIAFPDSTEGVLGSFIKFCSIFAITQVPLAIVEGIMTVLVLRLISEGQSTLSQQKLSIKQKFGMGIAAIACLAAPLLALSVDFGEGTDDRAGQMVEQLNPGHNVQSLFSAFEPSESSEPWLFALQVCIGLGLFAWAIWTVRKTKEN